MSCKEYHMLWGNTNPELPPILFLNKIDSNILTTVFPLTTHLYTPYYLPNSHNSDERNYIVIVLFRMCNVNSVNYNYKITNTNDMYNTQMNDEYIFGFTLNKQKNSYTNNITGETYTHEQRNIDILNYEMFYRQSFIEHIKNIIQNDNYLFDETITFKNSPNIFSYQGYVSAVMHRDTNTIDETQHISNIKRMRNDNTEMQCDNKCYKM